LPPLRFRRVVLLRRPNQYLNYSRT
jgi:hypothetical protein